MEQFRRSVKIGATGMKGGSMIPSCRIYRHETSGQGTLGLLMINDVIFCATMERPDLQNAPDISSIPTGQYTCIRVNSGKYGATFEVANVHGRSKIRFHWGNFVDETEGCVLLGQSFETMHNRRAVSNSKRTFKKFMKTMEDHAVFKLTIVEVY
jgi:hypothetical protein